MWKHYAARKPLAVLTVLFTVVLCTFAYASNRDIPPNVTSLLSLVVPACVASYAASSAYETCRGKDDDDG